MNNKGSLKIGIIGLGYWGRNILRNLFEMDAVACACDFDARVIKERRAEFPAVNYTRRFEDILNNREIKAVVISTPAATHYRLAKEALEKDKDVFVEKPLALTSGEGRELTDLAAKKKRMLMVGHILQYHPAVIKLKDMVKKGELGKLQYIYSNRLNIGKLKVEENILWSFAPHDISAILMLTASQPINVDCFGADYLNKGIFDVTVNTMEFKNDVKAHIFVSWLHPFKEQKLIVVGSKAMAVFDDISKDKLCIYPHRIERKNGTVPIAHKAEHYPVKVHQQEPLKEELKHFIECVTERKSPKTDGKEGVRVLEILEKADKAMKKNGARAALPQDRAYSAHPSACIDEGAVIGRGTKIWHFSHVSGGSKVGSNCKIGQNVFIGPDVRIGSGCKIQNNVSIYKGVTLEDEVFCGPSCVFTNVYNPRSAVPRMKELKATLLKKGATVGANATIVCGVKIGRHAFVGAGAVVNRGIPDHSLVVGVPARHIGWICSCGVKLVFKNEAAECASCGRRYSLMKGKVKELSSPRKRGPMV